MTHTKLGLPLLTQDGSEEYATRIVSLVTERRDLGQFLIEEHRDIESYDPLYSQLIGDLVRRYPRSGGIVCNELVAQYQMLRSEDSIPRLRPQLVQDIRQRTQNLNPIIMGANLEQYRQIVKEDNPELYNLIELRTRSFEAQTRELALRTFLTNVFPTDCYTAYMLLAQSVDFK